VRADPGAVETAEAGGGSLDSRVRVADLAPAGWAVTPWVRAPDGSATLTLSKPFARVDEVPDILAELNGDAGPLRDARFTRNREFFSTRYSARATLDPDAASAGVAADAELAAALAAQGVDVAALDQRLAAQIRDGVRIRLVVELPGRGPVAVTTGGDGAVALDATSSVGNRTRIVGVGAAVGLVVLAVAVACWPRRRRPGRGDRGVRSAPATGRRTPSAS
jgi:hypothetical protein